MLTGVLCAGLYPNIIEAQKGIVDSPGSWGAGRFPFKSLKGEVHLHPSTVMYDQTQLAGCYCYYHNIIKTSKLYVRNCTVVNPLALLLFGGALQVYQKQEVVTVDGWLRFRVSRKPATSIRYRRYGSNAAFFVPGEVDGPGLALLYQTEALSPSRIMAFWTAPSGSPILTSWCSSLAIFCCHLLKSALRRPQALVCQPKF
jgi:hypothetical protein